MLHFRIGYVSPKLTNVWMGQSWTGRGGGVSKIEKFELSRVQFTWFFFFAQINYFKFFITQIFTKKNYLLSRFSKLHNLGTHFCELLMPRVPPFQKIKWNSWNLVTTLQKSCFLGRTIFEILQPHWYYCAPAASVLTHSLFSILPFLNQITPNDQHHQNTLQILILDSWESFRPGW